MNNKVKFLRGTSNEYAVAEKDSDTIYFTTDDGKLYIGDKEVSGDGSVTIDNTLSDTSTNPVQNKIVKQAIDNKADKSLYGDTTINVGRRASSIVGEKSTAEGYNTEASGDYSHAEGSYTTASGDYSHAGGYHTEASKEAEFAHGKYNKSNFDTLFSIGDGTADDARHNAFEITTDGGKLHDKDIVTTDLIPTELPANGGNADTVGGKSAADFANAYNDYLDTYLVGKSGDIRELAYLLPTGGLWANTKFPELENITFPIEGDILITWDKSKYIQYGYIYGVLTIRPMTSTGDTYICSVYNTTSYTDWQKISDGGNADTLDGLHSTDFVNANIGQIQIPSNVDVPIWIFTNGKRYQQYMTNGGNVGLTNVPNNAGDYVWYWYDGINIIAREWVTGKYYICDTINGSFSGWKDIYTSEDKPYVTGTVTITKANIATISLDFIPSFVLYAKKDTLTQNLLLATHADIGWFRGNFDVDDIVHYIAFK